MTPQVDRTPGRKIRVAILFGGQSEEHDVSLRSAQTVINALDPDRYEFVPVGITRSGQWIQQGDPMARLTAASPLFALDQGSAPPPEETAVEPAGDHFISSDITASVDVVFPVLHGPKGEDGTVQGLLELAGVPYVGSGVLGSALAMDKAMAKEILARHGVRQAPWMLVERSRWQRDPAGIASEIADTLGFPCFTKPANMGSSVGVKKVHDPSELTDAMSEAARLDRRIVVEQGINARELEISVLGNDDLQTSCVGEIVPAHEFYDYEAKYIDERSQCLVPADIPASVAAEASSTAITAFRALDLAGLARVDFLLDRETHDLYLNEVNTLPGFTSISMYPMLWEASGLSNAALVDRLIELAIERHGERTWAPAPGEPIGSRTSPD
ncbi:MAG: D-alanine--D-alanine ligase [Thermomicrobiales bacterium]|nr:D-alanine--D-alanine ligase [Thermomicrobiales bacterium]